MIYLKKNEETQIVNIPKNGDYKGKLTYEEGFVAGYTDGLNDGRENPYSTKGFFFENGEKEFIYPVRINRDTMLQISFLGGNTSDYVEISFYPMGNGCVLANRNDSNIVCAMRGDLLRVFICNNLQFELPCKQEKWHTLRLYTDRVILDGEETYFNTPYMDSSFVCACVNRGGNGFYRGLIQYMKGVEGEAVMYYISNLDEGGFKRLRSDNGISDWYENSFVQFWGEFPILQTKVPLNSVFINVEGGNICPELTELNVNSNGRYEGAYNVVNVDVPDTNGSYDEGYTNGRNEGYDEGYNNVINNLQFLTITENGQYIPLGKYLMLDADDGFTMGNFTSNTVFNISFSIRGFDGVEGKNEFPILGGYPNGNWQGIKVTRNGELEIKWGGSITNIPVTTFRKYNLTLIPNPNGNEVVIMLDGNDTIFTSSMFEFETPIYLGSVLGDGAGFDFFEAKVWSNIDEFNNLNDAEYVYSPVENGILKNGDLISNRNGGYANLVTSEGFREIYVDVPQEGGNCNLEETRWATPTPDEIENGYLVYHPTDGYDGMQRIALQMDDYNAEKYNEGYEAGKAEGGGSCNIGSLDSDTNTIPHTKNAIYAYANEYGVDGWSYISIDYRPLRKEIAEQTKNKIDNELQTLTITENGHYEPTKVKCMEFDSDDIFYLGEFNSRNIYDITFIPKASNYDSKIFGGGVDGIYMGLSIEDGNIVARWGKYKAQAPYIEGEITHIVIKPFSDDSAFIINDELHSWWVDDESATDDFSADMYLGETDGRTANFDFYKMTIYEDYEGWVNDYNKIAVILPYADNQIDVQGVLKENIGDGAYCAMKEEKLSLGFSEVNVNIDNQKQVLEYDTLAFEYKPISWVNCEIDNNFIQDTQGRQGDCMLMRTRSNGNFVMTKFDNTSGSITLSEGWSNKSIVSLKNHRIVRINSNAIYGGTLETIDTGFALLGTNAITECSFLNDIKVSITNNNLSTQFEEGCFNGLPSEGTLIYRKNVQVTLSDEEIIAFFKTRVPENWTIINE